MKFSHKRLVTYGASLLLLATTGCGILTQPQNESKASDYPGKKSIELISWSEAGSAKDIMARQVGKALEKQQGWKVLVTDRTGGDGAVAMNYLKSKPADGHTLVAASGSMSVSLLTDLKSQFSTDDFSYIAEIQTDPYVLAVPAKSPIHSLAEAKRKGNLKVAGFGTSSDEHISAARISKATGIPITWVPFKGGSDAVAAALGNNVDAVFTQVSTTYDLAKAGKLRILGVTTAKPVPGLRAPTFRSLGYSGLEMDLWRGIIAKKGTPQSTVDAVAKALNQMPSDARYKKYVDESHIAIEYRGPDEFAKAVEADQSEASRYLKLISGP